MLKVSNAEIKQTRFDCKMRGLCKINPLYMPNISQLADFYFAHVPSAFVASSLRLHFRTFKTTALSGRKRRCKRILRDYIAAALLFRRNLFFLETTASRALSCRFMRRSCRINPPWNNAPSERKECSVDGISHNIGEVDIHKSDQRPMRRLCS